MKQQMKLKITLKSDLCAGSGYSYAGTIDSDVCYDENGIPYIPARRIKGCLREVSLMLRQKHTDAIFGVAGGSDYEEGKTTWLMLSNACVADYDSMTAELKRLKKSSDMAELLTTQNVLEEYTAIKAQTKLNESGSAQKNSLRFIRTVNQYAPDGKEMVFYAQINTASEEEAYLEELRDAAAGLRHMGMNRSRGLGNVRCELLVGQSQEEMNQGQKQAQSRKITVKNRELLKGDAKCQLTFTLRTQGQVIVSSDNTAETDTYISGQSVLGFFAKEYLRAGNLAETEEFERLFLQNRVVFSPLYPCGNGVTYYPAPGYVARLKKTKRFVNVSRLSGSVKPCDPDYDPANGNQPKKLTGKYLCCRGSQVGLREVETDVVYHHRHGDADTRKLYPLQVIRAGEAFAGSLTGSGEDLAKLLFVLERGVMSFGKSRSAQYGRCVVEQAEVKPVEAAVPFAKGRRILAVLRSDAIFLDENGNYTVNCDAVEKAIREELQIKTADMRGSEPEFADIRVKQLTGFYGKWNLKRQAVPAVAAGSCFEFLLEEDLRWEKRSVGERTGEGYGWIELIDNTDADWRMETLCADDSMQGQESSGADGSMQGQEGPHTDMAPSVALLCQSIIRKEAMELLAREAAAQKKSGLNAAGIGRLTLMLTESMNKFPGDPKKMYLDFTSRLNSIKDDEKRQAAWKFVENMVGSNLFAEGAQGGPAKVKCAKLQELEPYRALYEGMCGKGFFDRYLAERWADYLMLTLIQLKYDKKGEA